MNRASFNKMVAPGLFSFAVDSFKERPELWRELVTVKPSKKTYEESVFYAGFGLTPEKPEGEPITYDDMIQGPNIIRLLKSNLEVIKKAISGNVLSIINRIIPRKDYCVA